MGRAMTRRRKSKEGEVEKRGGECRMNDRRVGAGDGK